MAIVLPATAALAAPASYSFAIIPHPQEEAVAETALQQAIDATDADNLAFVVALGIKGAEEPCDDSLYARRRTLLNSAQNGIIVAPAASDWATCKTADGKSAAVPRLNRLREMFFAGDFSLGASRLPLMRQSAAVKFRGYGENARWQIGKTMFATVNLPANNNHYLLAAGRNSEFEDRTVANRYWLQLVFGHATRKKLNGIVLFCDGNPLADIEKPETRDGFLETRKQLASLARQFPGRVLIVHGAQEKHEAPEHLARAAAIRWTGNVATVEASSPWIKIRVSPALPHVYTLEGGKPAQASRK